MENQNCRVGTVTPITSGSHAVAVLEYRYQHFLEKASQMVNIDTRLSEFFESKAKSIKNTLEDLV